LSDQSPFQDPPFVGRKKELEVLAGAWDYVKAGEARAVALVGEAGIGKTRLADHFIESLELEDCIVFRGRCYEAEQSVPYGPIAEAIRSALTDVDLEEIEPLWLAEVARIVPEVRARCGELPDPPALEAEGGRHRLYEGIAQAFRVVCEARPAILFIDDLHWADESSVALLHYLFRRVTSGLYMVVAYRPEENAQRMGSLEELVLPESSASNRSQMVSARICWLSCCPIHRTMVLSPGSGI
jgi:predicted ATPase